MKLKKKNTWILLVQMDTPGTHWCGFWNILCIGNAEREGRWITILWTGSSWILPSGDHCLILLVNENLVTRGLAWALAHSVNPFTSNTKWWPKFKFLYVKFLEINSGCLWESTYRGSLHTDLGKFSFWEKIHYMQLWYAATQSTSPSLRSVVYTTKIEIKQCIKVSGPLQEDKTMENSKALSKGLAVSYERWL